MIVNALGLEKDGVLSVSPKVSHGVAAMASAGDDLQSAVTSTIGTRFTFNRKQNRKYRMIDRVIGFFDVISLSIPSASRRKG